MLGGLAYQNPPSTKDALVTNAAGTYAVKLTDETIIQTTAASTYTLPPASGFVGRVIHIVSEVASIVSASANVIPLAGGSASTAITSGGAGKFAILQSNGTNWKIIAAN
jgi:hypothetical protein